MSVDARSRLDVELQRCPFHDFLRPVPLGLGDEEDSVSVRLPCRPDFGGDRSSDVVHGGVIASLVDLTGSAAVAVVTMRRATTVDLRVDFLAPASGAYLDAVGQVLRAGRSLVRVDVTVRNENCELVAVGRGTWRVPRVAPSGL
jgi:uncharacterized protein (TIGR00369 family)